MHMNIHIHKMWHITLGCRQVNWVISSLGLRPESQFPYKVSYWAQN